MTNLVDLGFRRFEKLSAGYAEELRADPGYGYFEAQLPRASQTSRSGENSSRSPSPKRSRTALRRRAETAEHYRVQRCVGSAFPRRRNATTSLFY